MAKRLQIPDWKDRRLVNLSLCGMTESKDTAKLSNLPKGTTRMVVRTGNAKKRGYMRLMANKADQNNYGWHIHVDVTKPSYFLPKHPRGPKVTGKVSELKDMVGRFYGVNATLFITATVRMKKVEVAKKSFVGVSMLQAGGVTQIAATYQFNSDPMRELEWKIDDGIVRIDFTFLFETQIGPEYLKDAYTFIENRWQSYVEGLPTDEVQS